MVRKGSRVQVSKVAPLLLPILISTKIVNFCGKVDYIKLTKRKQFINIAVGKSKTKRITLTKLSFLQEEKH